MQKKDEKNAQKMRVGNYENILQILQIYLKIFHKILYTHFTNPCYANCTNCHNRI